MRKTMRLGLSAMILAGATVCAAPVELAKSEVRFVFTQMNVSVQGKFKQFSGDVSFDAARPEQGKVNVSIDLAGVDAGTDEANDALKGNDWFATARFPKATFNAQGFKPLGGGRYQATGVLALKGRSATIVIPFTARNDTGGQWLEGAFPLQRLSWKVGEGDWADVGTVADAVQVKFKLFVPVAGK